ncbi:hypothetical protein [Nostoc commune]|nr:hypothetical protein [Nostoc commune]
MNKQQFFDKSADETGKVPPLEYFKSAIAPGAAFPASGWKRDLKRLLA